MVFGPSHPPRGRDPRARHAGFSLLPLSFLLFALALAASFAVPAWQQAQRVSRARQTVAALERFANAFQDYAEHHGDWPGAVTAPGASPTGMDAALGPAWAQPAPIGGRYVWLVQTREAGERLRAAIGIVGAVTEDRRQMEQLALAAKAAGVEAPRLRFGFLHQPVYVLEE